MLLFYMGVLLCLSLLLFSDLNIKREKKTRAKEGTALLPVCVCNLNSFVLSRAQRK